MPQKHLPVATALGPAGTAGLWAANLATATGSVCRHLLQSPPLSAAGSRAPLRARQYSATGAALAVALTGLHLTSALHRPAPLGSPPFAFELSHRW